MATLELILEFKRCELWSWEPHLTGHQTARLVKQRMTPRGNIRVAYLGPRDEEPESLVVVKMARDNEVATLEKEYRIYMDRLAHLQGSVVPICYGLFRGKVEGERFACMLLEYCRGTVTYSLAEQNDQIMLGVCKLHQAGILHGSLDDMHHIVCSNIGVRIVDFSDVIETHRCPGAGPLLMHPNGTWVAGSSGRGCPELMLMEKIYGLLDRRR
ncbi:hypothetical protein GGU10DRAFT_303963 [Lentinula aff. detonsa]|uniref:Protein kinase domain-containing protein n=2 Tax=Lentinula TaxID=5352 RepID=A0AA38NRS2_9AGAR|nr:hypothetical protein GGU10DRAFT_303963 [Lentinula aff. detonsa]KAJ3988486.1 hypothetical protein F5890DRAFT_472806 [Lentinula detonsa]